MVGSFVEVGRRGLKVIEGLEQGYDVRGGGGIGVCELCIQNAILACILDVFWTNQIK